MPFKPADEDEIGRLLKAGNVRAAADKLYRAYSTEIFLFLWHRFDDEHDAEDACAECFASIYEALPRFRFEASFRTWAYRIARHAASYRKRTDSRWRQRFVHDETTAALNFVAEARRETTAAHLLTTNKNALRALRQEVLSADMQDIFAMLECKMPWSEIAKLCGTEEGQEIPEEELPRVVNRLQKKYERAARNLEGEFRKRHPH